MVEDMSEENFISEARKLESDIYENFNEILKGVIPLIIENNGNTSTFPYLNKIINIFQLLKNKMIGLMCSVSRYQC